MSGLERGFPGSQISNSACLLSACSVPDSGLSVSKQACRVVTLFPRESSTHDSLFTAVSPGPRTILSTQ